MGKYILQGRRVNDEWLEISSHSHAILAAVAGLRYLLRAWEIRIKSTQNDGEAK